MHLIFRLRYFIGLLIMMILFYSFNGCKESTFNQEELTKNNQRENFGIVIHGGAGTMSRKEMTKEMDLIYRKKLEEVIRVGHSILKNGGTSQEAVEKSINLMEDSPLFNAGKGAVLNSNGQIELDASFMNGKTLNAGAIVGVKTIKNPISAAIKVMENSPHVMFFGDGAEKFALKEGLEIVDPNYFFTQKRIDELKKVKLEENKMSSSINDKLKNFKFGTVGCVALDKNGNLAAGTSTGGMTNKKWNRIGDVPIIGAGNYANNKTCAISATGWGEFFIRNVVAYDISALMEYKGLKITEASKIVINEKVAKLGGDGGVIGIDKNGNIAMEMNTNGMYRAHMNSKGDIIVKIYSDE
jgi:beta-aspartyl-peptidase (threonine type)